MDSTDHRLIALLRHNARLSIADLATKLAVSRGTVSNRMRRLEKDGAIQGYTLKEAGAEFAGVRAWMMVQIEGTQTRRVVAALLGEPGVTGVHDTNGRWDLLAEIACVSMPELSALLGRIRMIKGIQSTETSIHLASFR